MNTLLRYRARLEREQAAARQALDALRQRTLAPRAEVRRPDEPEAAAPLLTSSVSAFLSTAPATPAARPAEPEPGPTLNRHQRRALAAMERRRAA